MQDAAPSDGCGAAPDSWKTPIGTPSWEPFGAQRFSIMAGTAKDAFAELFTSIAAIVSPNHKFYPSTNAYGPGTAHAGPYDQELAGLLAAKSIVDHDVFSVDEFTGPKGVVVLVMLAPRCTSKEHGSSADFKDGPILSEALFPLTINAPLYKGEVLFDPDMTTQNPGPSAFGAKVDGASHVLLVFGDSMEFAAPGATAPGSYEWRIRVVDQTGAGWNIHRSFQVK